MLCRFDFKNRRVPGNPGPTRLTVLGVGFFALAAASSLAVAEPQPASQVRRVVVYPDRALVTREASVACGSRVQVHFASLPPSADASSLRAQTSLGQIEGLRIEEKARSTAYSAAVVALDERIRRLNNQLAALHAAEARDGSEVQLASRYEAVAQTMIGRELSEPATQNGKPPASWNSALDTALNTRVQVAASRAERRKQTRDLQAQLQDLQQQRSLQAQADSRRDLFADVFVTCPKGQQATVDLSYLVGGAGFTPSHEARLDEAAGRVQLTSFATLQQSTGEDWPTVALTLSTAVPRQNATPPDVSPLRVVADPREPPKKVIYTYTQLQSHAEAPADLSKNIADRAEPSRGPGRPAPQQQGLSVQFSVASAATVRGDGTAIRVTLAERALPAHIAYRSVPKLLPYVFRIAELNNTAGYPLLAGDLDVFRRGQFVSRYPLDYVADGARMTLSFGLEDRLRVKRQVLQEITQDRGVFGGTRRHNYTYRFELQSFLDRADELEIAEHIPVSELSDIKVGLHPSTSPGHTVQAQDGNIRWRLRLNPGEQRALSLSYFVDVPSSYAE